MLKNLSSSNLYKPKLKQVRSLFLPKLLCFSTTNHIIDTRIDFSSADFKGIANSVLQRLNLFHKGNGSTVSVAKRCCCVKDFIFEFTFLVPEVVRKYRGVERLEPENVLEIVLGFEAECGKVGFVGDKVRFLWEFFEWSNTQHDDFQHLPQSYEVMGAMLVEIGMYREVELLLSRVDSQGVCFDGRGILCGLIRGFVGNGDMDRAVLWYDRMKGRGMVPQAMCYHRLLEGLVRRGESQLGYRVCLDMFEAGIDVSDAGRVTLDVVIRLLCMDAKIQEARNLVKKMRACGYEASHSVLDEMASGYCMKRDFEDLMSFLAEFKFTPDVLVGNKIIHNLCDSYGVERANTFWHELEHLGFIPNEITFGILIGWSCREENLKGAFLCLSEMLSRGLTPDVRSYNAIISGLFKLGMWKYARDVFSEMVEKRTVPNISTFKILLAGYCKARCFDEVKSMVVEMENRGLIQLSSSANRLSFVFTLLGFDASNVKLKRDNAVGLYKTEFFDNLGNGLYLDTDLDEYEYRVNKVLKDTTNLDFNYLIMEECIHGNLKTALALVAEMIMWGQEPSLSVLSELLKMHCASKYSIKLLTSFVERNAKLANQLDQETCNMLIQAYCRRRMTNKGMTLLTRMHERNLPVNHETYTAVIMNLLKKGTPEEFRISWNLARKDQWLPAREECEALLGVLCQHEMLKEVMELLENMLMKYSSLRCEVFSIFLDIFFAKGFTRLANIFMEEVVQRECILDHLCYSYILKECCKEKKLSKASTLLDNSKAKSLASRDFSSLVVSQLCDANRLGKDHSLSTLLLTTTMKGLFQTRKFGEALDMFKAMLSKGLLPDSDVYNVLVQRYCHLKNLRKIKELLCVMIREDANISVKTYRSLVRFLCIKGEIPMLLNLKEIMFEQHKSNKMVIYNILIFYLFSSGNSLLVNSVLNELPKKGFLPDAATYNFLVYGFSKCNNVPSTVHHLYTMIAKNLRPSSRSLRMTISCLCDAGDFENALELSRDMESRGWLHCSVIQRLIIEGLLSRGRIEEAEISLDQMVRRSLVQENIDYNYIIKKLCWYARQSKAVDLVNTMLKKKCIPDSTSYDSVVHCLCNCNKMDQAMSFIAEMLDIGLRPSMNSWSMLVDKFCQNEQTEKADGLLSLMVRIGETPNRFMYSRVINRYRYEKNLNKASELMQMMQQSGYKPDFETHWSLIQNLSNSRDKDNSNISKGFLSTLLSESGFPKKNCNVRH